jgi:epsilon-lactone hydrolase
MPLHNVVAGGVPAEWISAKRQASSQAILFLHGGGFRIGSIDSHRGLAQRLSRPAC